MSEEAATYEVPSMPVGDMIDLAVERALEARVNEQPPIDKLAKALAQAQLEIRNAETNTENEFLNSRYANLAAVMDVCRGPLAKHGLSLVQLPRLSTSPGIVELETMLIHESGQYISTVWQMAPPKADPQGLGSCLTYMRRYMASAMLGIAQADDDANRSQPGPDEYERITAKEADAILIEADKLFGDKAESVVSRMLDKVFSTRDNIIDRVTDIPAGQADQAINLLRNQAKRESAAGDDKKQKADPKKPQSDA